MTSLAQMHMVSFYVVEYAFILIAWNNYHCSIEKNKVQNNPIIPQNRKNGKIMQGLVAWNKNQKVWLSKCLYAYSTKIIPVLVVLCV